MGIRKSELMLKIIEIEYMIEKYDKLIDDLDNRLKKLEKIKKVKGNGK